MDQLPEPLHFPLEVVTKKKVDGSSRDVHRHLKANSGTFYVEHSLWKDDCSRRRIFKGISHQCKLQQVLEQERLC